MTGDFVKKKIETAGYQLNNVAEILCISPQNLHSKLKTKDIRVSLVVDIAKAINKPLDYFFSDFNVDSNQMPSDYMALANKVIHLLEENSRLKERLQKYEGADQ
jgi:hypothetical protein